MENSYNARCPAVKRLLREAQELHESTEEYFAQPLDDNLFEWHFTVRGPPASEYDGGVYHGRIIMPADYPMKPPNIIFLTPNGRFETNKKICLSISGYHPETWQPSWSIRTALLAIIGFMPTAAAGTIGALDYTAAERAVLARRSVDFQCCDCGRVVDLLKERTGDSAELQREAREVSAQMVIGAKNGDKTESNTGAAEEPSASFTETQTTYSTTSTLPTDSSIPTAIATTKSNTPANSASTSTTMSSSPQLSSTRTSTSTTSSDTTLIPTTATASTSSSLSLIVNNVILSAAVILLFALVLRRIFMLDAELPEEVDDIIL